MLRKCREAEDFARCEPCAYSILSVIAQRVSMEDNAVTGITAGECIISRSEFTYSKNSMSCKSYRDALTKLEELGFIKIRVFKNNTIVEMVDNSIFCVHEEQKKEKEIKEENIGYDPDIEVKVINRYGEISKNTVGNILDGIFLRYPGNANIYDRSNVADFIEKNPDYPLSIAVSREVELSKKDGYIPRNISNFIANPPDIVKVMEWFKTKRGHNVQGVCRE